MERKQFTVGFKADERGRGTAVISTMGVVDADGDIVEPGAFGSQRVVFLKGHDWQSFPLGHAEVHEAGDKAVADLELNLSSSEGRSAHQWLKWDHERGGLQEFSYGFSIVQPGGSEMQRLGDGRTVRRLKRLRLHEVSMVVRGSGVGTGLVAIKGDAAEQAELAESIRATLARGAEWLAKMEDQVSYRYIEMLDWNLLDPRRHLARDVTFRAARELGISVPALKFFTSTDPERAEFVSEKMWGYSRKGDHIAIEWTLSPAEMTQVVAHEVAHAAGLDEEKADAFGKQFAARYAKMLAAPRPGGHWSYEQAAAAAMWVRLQGVRM